MDPWCECVCVSAMERMQKESKTMTKKDEMKMDGRAEREGDDEKKIGRITKNHCRATTTTTTK